MDRRLSIFERALRFRPGDEGAQEGVDNARRAIVEKRARQEGEAEIDQGGGFSDALVQPFREKSLACALLVFEFLLLLALFLRSRLKGGARLGATLLSILFTFVCAGAAFGLMLKRQVFQNGEDAIVVVDHGILREGPDPRAASRGEVREGNWARILDKDGDFILVRSAGKKGWVETATIQRI